MGTTVLWLRQKLIVEGLVVVVATAWINCAAQGVSSDSHNERVGSPINGRVITSSGAAQRDARIELRSLGGVTVCSSNTDASGAFYCADVVPGRYELVVSAEIYEQRIDVSVASFNPELTIRLPDRSVNRDLNKHVSVSQLMVPSKAWKAFQKATERFQKSDLAGARLQLDKAIELWPRFAAALTLRGVLKTHSALPHDAVEDFNAALDADRTYGLAYIGLAENHNATGNFDEAMNVLDRGSAYLTQMWQLHYEVSKALFGKKSFSRALQEASRASTMLGHELPGLCFIKAEAYVNLGDARAARTELETYLKENGNRPGADRLHQLLASLNTR